MGVEFNGYFYQVFDLFGYERNLTKINIWYANEYQVLFKYPGYGFHCSYQTCDGYKIIRKKI